MRSCVTAVYKVDRACSANKGGRCRAKTVGAVWLLKDHCGATDEAIEFLTDEENLAHAKSVYVAANGDGRVTDAEKDWMIGYFTAAGASQSTIDALKSYTGGDQFEDFFAMEGVRQIAQRSWIWDAIRACGADGDLADEELATIHRMAAKVGIPAEVVDEFVDIYRHEQELKRKRIELAFPGGTMP